MLCEIFSTGKKQKSIFGLNFLINDLMINLGLTI